MNRPRSTRLPGLAPHHIHLLRAAVCDGGDAIAAWKTWRAQMTPDRADDGSTRIFSLVYRNLRAQGLVEEDLPPLLKGTCRHTWARTQPLLGAGIRAARLLADKGIDVLFIKGAAMTLSCYPHPDTRAMNDVDILVPFDAARDAIAALRAAGWQSRVPDAERLIPIRHAAEFVDAEGHRLDLHWHALLERCDGNSDSVLTNNARAVMRDGSPLRVASRESLLVMACVYGPSTPARPPLRWLADAGTLARGDMDWVRVVDMARQLQFAPAVRAALEFISVQLDVRLPEDVLEQIRAIPAPTADRRAHAFVSRSSPLLGCLPALWFNYRRGRPATPRVSFSRYVQYHFGLPRLAKLPGFVAKAGARRLAGPAH